MRDNFIQNKANYESTLNLHSKLGIPVGALNEEKVNFSTRELQQKSHILYVTMVSPCNTPTWNNTMNFLKRNFETRQNSDKDVWLIGLDISVESKTDERYALNNIH